MLDQQGNNARYVEVHVNDIEIPIVDGLAPEGANQNRRIHGAKILERGFQLVELSRKPLEFRHPFFAGRPFKGLDPREGGV